MMKYWFLSGLLLLLFQPVFAKGEGEVIYLKGTDMQGNPVPAILNDLRSDSALACVNCHRESGFGSSESGRTFPPVSWGFLGKNQPEDDSSRFYHIQNKRKAYDADSFYRLLTAGINSDGEEADPMMPRYALSRQQSDDLIAYLKTINTVDDPGVDNDVIHIATIVDKRLPASERDQHIAFLQSLFGMKNGLTRGEIRRKLHSPVQKIPQYESFRKWKLEVWELPEDTSLWAGKLADYYQQQAVFTVMRPMVQDNYQIVSQFCTNNKLTCFLPSGNNLPAGDFYNFVFRNSDKQQRDYIARRIREQQGRLLYLDSQGKISSLSSDMVKIPVVKQLSPEDLQDEYSKVCSAKGELLARVNLQQAAVIEKLQCANKPELSVKLMSDEFANYRSIVDFIAQYADADVCWITDYDKVLKRNMRKIRVNAMIHRFNIEQPDDEEMAKTLLAYSLIGDSLHQMAGNFSRVYMLEMIEHMLNSTLNYSYYTSVTGAPYQRFIVGPVGEYCQAGSS
jgi:hypothetical protein